MKALWGKVLTWLTKWVMRKRTELSRPELGTCCAQMCLHDDNGTVMFPCMRELDHSGEHAFGSKNDRVVWMTSKKAERVLATTFRRDR
jgi:hypothetical protein